MTYTVFDQRPSHAGSFTLLRQNPTWQEVAAHFHLGVDASQGQLAAQPGELYWKFAGVSLQEGPTVYRVQVWGLTGNPVSGMEVVRHYSSAELLNRPSIYSNRGVIGRTEAGGDKFGIAEFVYAGSSWTSHAGGPDSFWVLTPTGEKQLSDRAYGFGWDPRTNHFNPSPIFQLTVKGGTTPEPEPEPEPEPPEPHVVDSYRLAVLGPEGRVVGYEQYQPGMPPKGRPCWVILKNGQVWAWRGLES